MPKNILPDWDLLLSTAAQLQSIIPGAVMVGGTAAALYAHHRISQDADHVMVDLRSQFDDILKELESVAGWQTTRVNRPVQILGSLDGIETGIRQLIRIAPLETMELNYKGQTIVIPTLEEILRIKGWLIVIRNATRDYLDFAALADAMEKNQLAEAMGKFDTLYPQGNGQSALQQLQIQLSDPRPFDLGKVDLVNYKNLDLRWQDWGHVQRVCKHCGVTLFDVIGLKEIKSVVKQTSTLSTQEKTYGHGR